MYLIQIYIEIVVAQLHDEQIVGALVLNCLMSKLDINVVYGLQTEEIFVGTCIEFTISFREEKNW